MEVNGHGWLNYFYLSKHSETLHCKNRIVKITNILVSTVARI